MQRVSSITITAPDPSIDPAFAIESFIDLDSDVRQSILRVRRSDFIPHRDNVRGFIYDVDTHALREVSVDADD